MQSRQPCSAHVPHERCTCSRNAKLRLAVADVCEWLADAGFGAVERVACGGGLVGLVAR